MSASINISDITCPITLEIMNDPVTGNDGFNYDGPAIREWLRVHGTSPNTRRPMFERDLIPNRLLRDQIERYRSIQAAAPTLAPLTSFKDAAIGISAHVEVRQGVPFLNVVAKPPAAGERQDIVMGFGADCSGSMGLPACDSNETGGLIFTRLDLVKQCLLALIATLGAGDILFLVKFSNAASLALTPTRMDASGKALAVAAVKALSPDGSTNIWNCLQVLNQYANKPEFAGSNVVTAMLTDGLPNIRPPSQDEALEYKALTRRGTLSTFGLGYDLDSKLLSSISEIGGGGFGFIPDYSVVGTVIINWGATVLATASRDRVITVNYSDGSSTKHNTGLIQYGQDRNLTFQMTKMPVSVSLDGGEPVLVVQEQLGDLASARFAYIQAMRHCIGRDGDPRSYDGMFEKWSASAEPNAKELVRDVKPMSDDDDEGQIMMAPRFWAKWGKHYTRSYKRAVELEQCLNFKDPGLQILGGDLFHSVQKVLNDVFCNLPPLQPSGTAYAPPSAYRGGAASSSAASSTATRAAYVPPPINMGSVFMNQTGGCWAPGSMVRMADDSRVPVEEIRRGMRVWTVSGPATVDYSLALGSKTKTHGMSKYQNLWITPWHPVLRDGKWVFPSSFTTITDCIMPVVYNMVLNKGHVIDVSGVLTVTLGHGLKEDLVAHDFFGNRQAILSVLSKMPGFNEGHVVFDDLRTMKNPITNVITGWYNGPKIAQ